jgi:UDP-N-acetylmuramoyl-L-alanyl-D-glutamate--2,6-diaminopimelate ligase
MGEAAAEGSDVVILTSDNPRTEDPLAILADARQGLEKHRTPFTVEADRAAAIRKAVGMAEAGDLVLLAGKGHEDYQIVGKTKFPFDDRLVAREALAAFGYTGAAR